jgi:hypothetical protein
MTLTYVGAGSTPSTGPTPGIVAWKSYVVARWPGGVDLGTWAVRNIRGGSSLSVHAVGRAWDWRYASPGPGRRAAEEAIAFAVDHHELLGIQAIHDYVSGRIWRSSRPGGVGPMWKPQPPGNGMGAKWATYLHWEVHPRSALHRKTVRQVLAEHGVGDEAMVDRRPSAALPQPTLRRGDRGDRVVQLQQVLWYWKLYSNSIDGNFGPRTEAAVKAWQRALQPLNVGPVDGVYGPRTHAAAAASYATLQRMVAA